MTNFREPGLSVDYSCKQLLWSTRAGSIRLVSIHVRTAELGSYGRGKGGLSSRNLPPFFHNRLQLSIPECKTKFKNHEGAGSNQ